jgi:hypothetical protein
VLGQHGSSSSSLGLQGQQPVQRGTPYQMQFSALVEPLGTGSYSGGQAAPGGMPVPVAAVAPGLLPAGGAEVQLASLAGGADDAGNMDPYGAQLAEGAEPAAAGRGAATHTPFVDISQAVYHRLPSLAAQLQRQSNACQPRPTAPCVLASDRCTCFC